MVGFSLKVPVCLLVSAFSQAAASAFLKPLSHTEKHVSRSVVQQTLSSALSMDLGKLKDIEDEFKPLHATLPRDEHGTLEPSVVRYALHRYFVQKHGWFMKGLDPRVSVTDVSSEGDILKEGVPAFIQSVIDHNLKGQGWGLHELAIYAAALTELVRVEATQDLDMVYEMLGWPIDRVLTEKEAELVTTAYILHYTLEENHTFTTFESMLTEVIETYPGWDDFNMWAQDVRSSVAYLDRTSINPFVETVTYQQILNTVQEIGHQFGAFQKDECRTLSSALLDMEFQDSGRIPLSKFWEVGLKGTWRFWESEEYLRFMGVLDEDDGRKATVMIPNFLSSQSNCVGSSSFFSVCCVNECESLMTKIESRLPSPEASVDKVIDVISGLESETVDAPRILPDSLVLKLKDIADHNHGSVQIHGRLFSQWLHHAYPRECPFPILGHVRAPLAPDQWTDSTGVESVLSDHRMASLVRKNGAGEEMKQFELPWSMVEDHMVVKKRKTKESKSSFLRVGMAVLALVSFLVPLVRATKVAMAPVEEKVHAV